MSEMQEKSPQSVVSDDVISGSLKHAATPAAQLSAQALLTQELSSQELSSQELFRKGNTVRIDHAGQTYWLRLTRGNKLILTK